MSNVIGKVLVTGGAGYIGTFVVEQLLQKGYYVVVLDSLIYGGQGLDGLLGHKNLKLIKGDITDPIKVEEAINGVDGVIALAAIVGDPACQINEAVTRKVNYESVKLLVDLSIKNSLKRFVFASSCSVYGSNEHVKFLTEDSELNPVSLYAITRVESENYILSKNNLLTSVILRLSTVYGLSRRMRFDLAVNVMTAKAIQEGGIEVYGGNQWRPFVHVQDVARAFVVAYEASADKISGEIFNVGDTDSNYQIDEVARLIQEELPQTRIKSNATLTDLRNYNVIFDKLHKRLNYKTQFSLRDGVREISEFILHFNPEISDSKYSNLSTWKAIDQIEKFIPYAVPDLSDDERKEVIDTIDSGWLSAGPKSQKFEFQLKDYFQEDDLEIIPVSSCTAALHLQLLAADIGPGDEVITSPLTFCATVNTILYTGATPVLVDVDPSTYNIDLGHIEKAITPNTKAIVPVYYAGQAVDHTRLKAIAQKYNLLILADAAHAMGAKYDDRLCGTYEDSAAFSFYATKNMATGEGGLICTRNKEKAEKIRRLLQHGMDKDAWKRYSEAGSWFYDVSDLGYKYNFTDVQAAFGLHQLRKLDQFNSIRRSFGEIYDEAFKGDQRVQLHGLDPRAYYTRHLYPIVIKNAGENNSRNEFIDKLKNKKIGASVHYVPIHHHSLYMKRLGYKPGDFPVTDAIYRGLVSLPLYTKMTHQDILRTIDAVITSL